MKVSTTGYKRNSKDKKHKQLYIPGDVLTMLGVDDYVQATPVYPNGSYGGSVTMKPGVPTYNFPGAAGVIEQKLDKFALGGPGDPNKPIYSATKSNPEFQTINGKYVFTLPDGTTWAESKLERAQSISNYLQNGWGFTGERLANGEPAWSRIPKEDIKPKEPIIEDVKIYSDPDVQKVLVNTPEGDITKLQNIKTKKFIGYEVSGKPLSIENATGDPSVDFRRNLKMLAPSKPEDETLAGKDTNYRKGYYSFANMMGNQSPAPLLPQHYAMYNDGVPYMNPDFRSALLQNRYNMPSEEGMRLKSQGYTFFPESGTWGIDINKQGPGEIGYKQNGGSLPQAQNGGDMPFGLPLKEQNIYTLPEYNQPINPKTGEILPDPRRPDLGMGTKASEFKYTYGTDEGDIDIPSIVAGQYIGGQALDRYKLTGERFKTMTNPGSYSDFYMQMRDLGLMQEKQGGELPKAQYGLPDWRNMLDYKNAAPPAKQNLVGDVRKVARPTAVAESTKVPTQKLPDNYKELQEQKIAQDAYDALPEALKRRDVLTADTRSDAEKFARRAWTAVSQPMETIAAVNRGYDIPSGYMGMHDAYEGYGVGSPMTSVVDMAAGLPAFIGNAAYRQGEQIVDDPLNYAYTMSPLGIIDPETRGQALGNYLDLAAVIPTARMAAGPLVKNAGKFLTTQTPLKNAYKYNPWAFKPNEDNWYRQIGKSAVDDALDTRLIREAGEEVSPRMLQEFEEQLVRMQGNGMEAALAGRRPASPFFLKGELFYPMGRKPTITKSGKVSKNPAGKGNADYLIETSMSNDAFQPAYVKGLGLGVPTEVGQTAILKPNPSLRNIENFNFYKQDWLKGYKAIDTPTVLPGSSNSYQYQIRGLAGTNTSTGLTEENVADAISRQKDWLKSEEYVKRRSANTGETLQEVRQDRDKILSVAEDARFNLNSNITAQGQMTPKSLFERFPKVEIAKHANNPINTLEHETAHLYSPSIFGKSDAALHKGLLEADVANLPSSERGVYANYPTLGEGFDKTAASIDLGATENYLKTGPEQQVRHLNARADILKANSLPMDAQLTEAEVKPFIDDWAQRINKLTKDTKDPINLKNELDYDEIWLDEAYKIRGNLLKEYGVASDLELTPLQRKEYVQRTKEELTKNVTSVLNKAWVAVPGAIGVGVATQQKKKGGPVNKRNHKDLDNYFAQAWSKSRKTA